MKVLYSSFLFLYCLTISFHCIAQIRNDSLLYYSNLTNFAKSDNDLIKSYIFFEKLLKNSEKTKEQKKIIYSLWYKSNIEFKQGFYIESEKNATKALLLLDKEKATSYTNTLRKSLFNQLGILYKEQFNYDQAINLYNSALKFAESEKDSITLFNNIANVYSEKQDYRKAEEILTSISNRKLKGNNSLEIARVLSNLGLVKSKLNNNEGIKKMLKALELRKAENNNFDIYNSYYRLAEYYKYNADTVKSKEYALKSLELANTLKSISYQQNSLGLLTELSADDYSKRYKKITDSIIKAKQKSQNKFALLKYNTSKQEQIAKENELKAEKEKRLKTIYKSSAAFILLLSLGSYFFYREKNKKKIVERVIETEGRISKTVHDVIANDVYHIMTKLQGSNHTKDDILDALDDVYHKARNISRDNYVIDGNMDFKEILNDLFNCYHSNETSVITKNVKHIHWGAINIHKKNMLYRVLKELLTNMSKYSQANLVTIVFNQKGKQLITKYKDNGIGCNLSKKNGLRNAETRIKSINGQIIFESKPNNGFKAKITI